MNSPMHKNPSFAAEASLGNGVADSIPRGDEKEVYANPHIPSFLALPMMNLEQDSGTTVQVVHQGSDLTAENFRQGHLAMDRPVVIMDTPSSIGMRVPPHGFTVRNVAEKVGEAYPVHVLDVQLQTEMEGWTMGDLVEYFEDDRRHAWNQRQQQQRSNNGSSAASTQASSATTPRRPRRAAALQSHVATSRPAVLNQLSLELSRTSMGPPFVLSPQFVRDMDWIDQCWPTAWRRQNKYPMVQYYCLTSAAGAWTDFHIDFGGTSVWYHVLSGAKEFCLIAPTADNLQAYQKWMCSKHQDADFLPDILLDTKDVYKLRLEPDQTLVIPSGWIHAVFTPVDSLVLGGNFLHGLAISTQLQAYKIEQACRVPDETLFPYFRQLHVYAVGHYYEQLLKPTCHLVQREKEGIALLLQTVEAWVYHDDGKSSSDEPTVQKVAQEMAQKYGFSTFGALLDDLRRRLQADVPEALGTASSHRPTPRIRLRTKTESANSTITTVEAPAQVAATETKVGQTEEPMIQLSEPQRALPIPAKLVATRKREDMASFVDNDDEWTPSGKKSPKRPRAQTVARNAAATAKKKTSSRSRLWKKLK